MYFLNSIFERVVRIRKQRKYGFHKAISYIILKHRLLGIFVKKQNAVHLITVSQREMRNMFCKDLVRDD